MRAHASPCDPVRALTALPAPGATPAPRLGPCSADRVVPPAIFFAPWAASSQDGRRQMALGSGTGWGCEAHRSPSHLLHLVCPRSPPPPPVPLPRTCPCPPRLLATTASLLLLLAHEHQHAAVGSIHRAHGAAGPTPARRVAPCPPPAPARPPGPRQAPAQAAPAHLVHRVSPAQAQVGAPLLCVCFCFCLCRVLTGACQVRSSHSRVLGLHQAQASSRPLQVRGRARPRDARAAGRPPPPPRGWRAPTSTAQGRQGRPRWPAALPRFWRGTAPRR